MNLRWKNLTIQIKILIIGFLIILSFSGTIFGILMPKLNQSIVRERESALKNIVIIAMGAIRSINKDYEDGKLTLEEAQDRAKKQLAEMKYGSDMKDYVWINDLHPRMVMHPFKPEMNGMDMTDYKDPKGKRFFVEFVDVCNRDGSGFVNYMWQKGDNKDLIVDKLSYVELYKPWGWIIGTGIYLDDVSDYVWGIIKNMFMILAAIIVLSSFVLITFSRSIRKQIRRGIDFAAKLAVGNLTERVPVDREDELGMLGNALNATADNLEKLISEIIVAAQNLAQAVQEISSGNENLSQRTSEQASSLEEVASTIEETTATINQNADNSKDADKLSRNTALLADDGAKVVGDAVAAIMEISVSSKKIEDIITVINEISFQTNLLALNAAVEAARAGEQGRGFAVVASEVRNLAQRSGTAAKEIADLIKDSRIKVEKGTDLGNKSGDALKKINEAIRGMTKLISEISAASEEQRQGVSQINIAVTELDSMTQQNAGLVEETASASEEMANQAQELLAMMERFKIRDMIKDETQTKKHQELHLKSNALRSQDKHDTRPLTKKAAPVKDAGKPAGKSGSIEEILTTEGFEEF